MGPNKIKNDGEQVGGGEARSRGKTSCCQKQHFSNNRLSLKTAEVISLHHTKCKCFDSVWLLDKTEILETEENPEKFRFSMAHYKPWGLSRLKKITSYLFIFWPLESKRDTKGGRKRESGKILTAILK